MDAAATILQSGAAIAIREYPPPLTFVTLS
jgi:hypothetical protein